MESLPKIIKKEGSTRWLTGLHSLKTFSNLKKMEEIRDCMKVKFLITSYVSILA
jgi:hypothetical protein